ncbi:MAG: Sir2 family NAD-dependent protein deacetylase [Chloroflexi bacterium]|nr:Sir2 family NAD-dependent protein deacetylase [Chloroflexota bacterium]
MDQDIERLAALIAASRRIVAFTGAGISTESGIPDYRSPGGVWDRHAPIQYQDFLTSADARRETWRRGLHTYPVVAAARPNAAHSALVELERRGRLRGVVTQNVDGLHQEAGHLAETVVELHGNAHGVRCLVCDARYSRADVQARVRAGEAEPACGQCDGTLKPMTVSFGEPMPQDALRRADRLASEADLMLVVGSSLVVYPAAHIPRRALEAGARLAIVNATPTPLDEQATLVTRGQAAEILPCAVDLAGTPR